MMQTLRTTSRATRIAALSALLAGVLAWWLANRWQLAHVMVPVVTAARAIAAGSVLGPGDLRVREFPLRYVPPQSLQRMESVLGQVALAPLAAEEIFTATRVASVQQTRSLLPLLREGERAVTVSLAAENALGGFLAPEQRIDLLGSLKSTDARAATAAALVFPVERDVRVLAVNRDTALTATARKAAASGSASGEGGLINNAAPRELLVTLALQPEQVTRVLFVADHGRLHVVLRAASAFGAEIPNLPMTATGVVSLTNAPMEYHGTIR